MFDILKHSPKINPYAKELYLKGEKNNLAILIHGYTGCPKEMTELGKYIHKKLNYSVIVPRLPGHGTDSIDFQNSTKDDWLRKIYELIINNQDEYENINLIGLSMGALISLLSSIHFKIKSLILISPALYAQNRRIIFTHILKYFKPILENEHEIDSDIEDPDLIDLLENYRNQDYTEQIAELHKLMVECRKNLNKVEITTKIIHSLKDNVVPLKAANKIYKNIGSQNKDLTLFEDSPHVINYGPEKERLFNEVIKFLKIV